MSERDPLEQDAIIILQAIWRGMNPDLKRRYARTVWTQFENTVRASAYTDRLARFLDVCCMKLDSHIADAGPVVDAIRRNDDRAILRLIREQATLLTLEVRVAEEERKAAAEQTESEPRP